MKKTAKIFVAGDKDILGKKFIHYFRGNGFRNVFSESTHGIDLLNRDTVDSFFKKEKPEYVFLMHLKSGGIIANINYPAEFIYDNLQIQNNIIHCSYMYGVKKLFFLGSSCVYPRDCPQPMKEEYLLTGELEGTSEPYSIAKIAGIKMCQSYNKQYGVNFICAIPATIYGPGDHFDTEKSHVISSLIGRFHSAKMRNEPDAVVWGTGKPHREFIYVDDVIDACEFLTDNYDESKIINVGCGQDISIEDLAKLIKNVTGFKGEIIFDTSKPDGTFRKLLDNRKITTLGWKAKTSFEGGINLTYNWYKEHINLKRGLLK